MTLERFIFIRSPLAWWLIPERGLAEAGEEPLRARLGVIEAVVAKALVVGKK